MEKLFFILILIFSSKIYADETIMERSSDTPTGWWYFTNTTEANLNNFATTNNYRIIDIERVPGSTGRYAASLVKNTGEYQVNGWWWYYGDAAFISSKISEHNARIIDLETYQENNQRKFIAVMVSNTGDDNKAWWWYHGQTSDQISQHLSRNNARLISLESYPGSLGTRYAVVMIRNTGADQKGWWWYFNVDYNFITTKLNENNARPFDLNRRTNGRFDIVMVRNDGTGNWWHTNRNAAELDELISQTKSRIIDLEPYSSGGQIKFAVISLDNANDLEKRVRNFYNPLAPGARRGFYLKQIGGSELANVRGSDNFVAASSMKVLYLYTTLDRVRQNLLNLTNLDKSLCGADTTQSPGNAPTIPGTTSCPYSVQRCPFNLTTVSLQTLLSRMMIQSNNRATQSVRELVTQNRINQTANNLGMNNTQVSERIGCGLNVCTDNQGNEVVCSNTNNTVVDFGYRGNPLNGNQVTLADYAKVYESVFDGDLGNQTNNFFSIMLSNISSTSTWVTSLADAENATVGLSASELDDFKSKLRYAWKGGNYTSPSFEHNSISGSLSVPHDGPRGDIYRNYAFGVFQDSGPNGQNNVTTSVAQELIRGVIRAGMQSYNPIFRSPTIGEL
jgi:Beta-lactamase enzyme family/Bacterial tandem repeat domain 1